MSCEIGRGINEGETCLGQVRLAINALCLGWLGIEIDEGETCFGAG